MYKLRKCVAAGQPNYHEMRTLTLVKVLYFEKVPDVLGVDYGRLKNINKYLLKKLS